ncbi:MAG: hypothetical protein WC693_03315 [Patescibacteria group bacterium]|jgi:hypothetical protein
MKKLIIILALVVFASNAVAGVTNTKLLLHGTKPATGQSSWQVAAWEIIPNFAADPTKNVFVAGPRYKAGDRWWIELMSGALTVKRESTPLIDLRASFDALDPVHLWTNIEYFPQSGDWYVYFDINYRLPAVGLVGVETENNIPNNTSADLSIGPRAVLPFNEGKLVLISTYQFHNHSENQLWFRTVLTF